MFMVSWQKKQFLLDFISKYTAAKCTNSNPSLNLIIHNENNKTILQNPNIIPFISNLSLHALVTRKTSKFNYRKKTCTLISLESSFYLGWHGWGGNNWNPRFVGHLNDWELDDVEDFFSRIQGETVKRDVKDRMVWMGSRKAPFTPFWSGGMQLPSPFIWNSLVPSKVYFFAWEVKVANQNLLLFEKKSGYNL